MVGQQLVPYEMPQDGSSVAYKAQPGGQSCARPASHAVTQQAQDAGRTPCLSRTRRHHPRQSLGEDGLPTVSVATSPAANGEPDRTGRPWIGRSQKRRSYELCRTVEMAGHLGHAATVPMLAA